MVVFHHTLESIKNFWFPLKFLETSVPNSRSNIRQTLLSGTGFFEKDDLA